MPTLPSSTDITSASATEGSAKVWFSSVRSFIASLLGTDGTQKTAQVALGTPMHGSIPKSGAYTVLQADRGKVIRCTGTWTLSISAAAVLADGFVFCVYNEGAGTITVDPNLSELIDGELTKTIPAGKMALIYCDGTKFSMVGAIATGSGSGLDADLLDGKEGSYYAPLGSVVLKDQGHGAVGSFVFGRRYGVTTEGGIYPGSGISPAGLTDSGEISYLNTASMSGSWRALGRCGSTISGGATLFQRIA